jgi:hypothetical protein
MKTFIIWLSQYWLIVASVLCFVGALLILRKGLKDAEQAMTPEQERMYNDIYEGSQLRDPEYYFGDNDEEIIRLRKKLDKVESEYKDRSDITEEDLEFMSHINCNQN